MVGPGGLWALVAVLAAAAIALPLADPGSTAPGPGPGGGGARQVVRDALTASLGESTVQTTFTASVDAGAMSAQLSGTGAADLTTRSATMHVSGTVADQHESVAVEVVGGTVYVDVPQVAAVDPGKTWLSLRPGSSTGIGSSVGGLGTFADPGLVLPFLRRSGAVVTPLGASTLNGTSVQGYRVAMDAAAIGAAAAGSHLPGGIARQVHQLVVTAYVSGHLLRALDVAASGHVSVTASIDFHGYGEPVSVQPPAPTTVVPLSQFAGSALPAPSRTA